MSKATRDNLGTPASIERVVATATKGPCYLGVCAVGYPDSDTEFAIFAKDADTVERIWDKLMWVPLNRDKLDSVGIVARERVVMGE